MTPENHEIDATILSVCEPDWKKVAMIVARASKKLTGLPDGDPGYQMIGKRIKSLVRKKQLAARGNVDIWRRSEVRLPH